MSTNVTVNLPDSVCQNAQVWAEQTGRTLPDFLAEAIESSLLPLGNPSPTIHDWADNEVLAAAEGTSSSEDHRRLSELLAQQRENTLDDQSRGELASLMQAYQERLVRSAHAWREAVRRGLRGPLES